MNTDPKTNSPWPMKPIGELLGRVSRRVDVSVDERYREIGIRSHCRGIFHKPETTGAKIGDKRVFWVEPGCLTFNIIFAWEQAVAMTSDAESGMIASHRFPMYRSRNGQLLPEYAWRYFTSARGKYDLGVASPGGAGRNKTLGQGEFGRLKVPVPPIEYQKVAVEILAEADTELSLIGGLISAKSRFRDNLAQQLLSGRRRMPGFKKQWQLRCLGELGEFSKGSGLSKSDLVDNGVPAVLYGELYTLHNNVVSQIQSYVPYETAKRAVEIRHGDVLFPGSGETPTEVGMPSAYILDESAVAGGDVIIFRPTSTNSVYLAYALKSSAVRRQMNRVAQGHSVCHIYSRDLVKLHVLIPEAAEQRQIVGCLQAVQSEIDLLRQRLTILQRRRHGLMQRILTGRVCHKV